MLTPRADHPKIRASAGSVPHPASGQAGWPPTTRTQIQVSLTDWLLVIACTDPRDVFLVPSPTSFWLVTAPADSAGAEQLGDLNQAVGKHVQSTSLVEFPDFKVSIQPHRGDHLIGRARQPHGGPRPARTRLSRARPSRATQAGQGSALLLSCTSWMIGLGRSQWGSGRGVERAEWGAGYARA